MSLVPQDLIAEAEEDLHKLLNEVRNEIEENEMVHGLPLKVPRCVFVLSLISWFNFYF